MKLRWFAATALLCACFAGGAHAQDPAPGADPNVLAVETERQIDAAVARHREGYERLHRIWWRLITANASLCPNRSRVAGFMMHSVNSYPLSWRASIARRFRLNADAAVAYVASGSPAEAAGLRVSDRILSINGDRVRPGRLSSREIASDLPIKAANGHLDEALATTDPVLVRVLRDGVEHTITYQPGMACADKLVVLAGESAGSVADGERLVGVSAGLIRHVGSDDELAIVLGHNLGHDAAQQRERVADATRPGRWARFIIEGVFGAAAGFLFLDFGALDVDTPNSMRPILEPDADYLGLYFAARAGFDTSGAERLWRNSAGGLNKLHPTSAQRYAFIASTHREIAAKRAAGMDLQPNPTRAPNAISAAASGAQARSFVHADSAGGVVQAPPSPLQPAAGDQGSAALQQ